MFDDAVALLSSSLSCISSTTDAIQIVNFYIYYYCCCCYYEQKEQHHTGIIIMKNIIINCLITFLCRRSVG